MITYERWREVYLVKYRGALYVNYNSQKLLFPHNACTASEVRHRRLLPPSGPITRSGTPGISSWCGCGVRGTYLARHRSLYL